MKDDTTEVGESEELKARQDERAAVVKWLRDEAENWYRKTQTYRKAGNDGPYLGQPTGWSLADAIERGEHLKGGE